MLDNAAGKATETHEVQNTPRVAPCQNTCAKHLSPKPSDQAQSCTLCMDAAAAAASTGSISSSELSPTSSESTSSPSEQDHTEQRGESASAIWERIQKMSREELEAYAEKLGLPPQGPSVVYDDSADIIMQMGLGPGYHFGIDIYPE